MTLGMLKAPKETGNERTTTLEFRLGSSVDLNKTPGVPSKAYALAELLKAPSWRLTGVPGEERESAAQVLARARAREEPTKRDNMKWPRKAPSWLKHDKQVLRFYAFFQETVVERWDENCRYRNCVILYYMEDATIRISEPKIENSGIPQGSFLKRGHIQKPDGSGQFGPMDFKIGEEVTIYGISYHVTGCDLFTRWFFKENDIELPEDEQLVQDQWQKTYTFQKIAEKGGLPMSRSAVEAKILCKYQLGQPPADLKFVQFLENDRKVLRFKGYWDDPTPYGSRMYFVMHFYLADNTVEINEAHVRNSGRAVFPVFYRRSPLYKENICSVYPGMLEPEKKSYEPQDLFVGSTVNVWGRTVVLYDCDEFTQNFYMEFLGYDQSQGKVDVSEVPLRHAKLLPPPHAGVGSEEDSLINCLMVRPKPPKQDLVRLITYSGIILRFEAKMVNGEPEDENRRFIIGFFPADDHTACWELEVRNSGHMGGKFAEKGRRKNPDTRAYFKLQEFAVGKIITLAAQAFYIIRADEHTLKFMEQRPEELPFADPLACALRLSPIADEPEMQDESGIDPDSLKYLAARAGVDLLDHEIITLLRACCVNTADGEGVPLVSGPMVLDAIARYR